MGVCGGGGLDKGQKYNRFSTNMIAFFCKMSVVGGVQDIFRILIVLNATHWKISLKNYFADFFRFLKLIFFLVK